jgi:hypothetical protein
MEDEVTDVRSAEVHQRLDLWVRNDRITVGADASGRVVAAIQRRRPGGCSEAPLPDSAGITASATLQRG